MMCFSIPGKPQPKQRARVTKAGHAFTPKATTDYERSVGAYALTMRPCKWPLDAKYSVQIDAYFPDARRRDVDNVIKSVLDGLNGILWGDDYQVAEVEARKHIDREHPRTVVTVEVW